MTPFIRLAVAGAALLAVPAMGTAQSTHKAAAKKESKTIVEVAQGAGTFKTLVAAVQAAGLAETLSGKGPFTVFAPTDAAFAKLPEGTVEALLKDKTKLAAILTYHVLPGKVVAGDVIKAGHAKPATVNGQALEVHVKDGKVYVNNAQVTSADVGASNGVIHVIDTVLLPRE